MNANLHLDEYIDLKKYLLVLKRRWKPATAIFVSTVGLSLIAAFSMDKIYKAEAKLLIKVDRSAKLTGLENGRGEIEGLTTESDPLATEAEIIQSYPIVQKLIEELSLRDGEGELLKYKNVASALQVEPIAGTDLLTVSYTNPEPELAASIVNEAVKLYIEDHNLNKRAETAAANKFIAQQLPVIESNVKQAEANLRNFKNKNRIASLKEETTVNITSLAGVATEIDRVKTDLEEIDASYQQLQEQLNMSWQEASAVSALSQSLAVQKVLGQLQEVKLAIAQKGNYMSDLAPQMVALKEEEAKLTALLDRQIAQTLGTQQQALVDNVNLLDLGELKREQIAEFANLGLQKKGLEGKIASLNDIYRSYQQKSDTLPELQEQQRELERRVEAAQSTYEILLRKLQETQVAEQQNTGNVRVVTEAIVPDTPVGPQKKLIIAGAGVIAVLLSTATALVLDWRDRTLKNTQEVEAMLPYTLLGVIPDRHRLTTKADTLPSSSTEKLALPELAATDLALLQTLLPIKEAYHNLQVNLKLLDKEIINKVILVTSALSGEGKSSVSSNLAVAKAQCGQKVLLIDGDLRCPTQHQLWEVANNSGLSNVLNQELEWQQTVQQVMPNLDLITSGETPADPISLLNSPIMQSLLVSANGVYDCIIIDTPPLLGLADTKILGELADGLLFVVRPGVANYDSINAAKKTLENAKLNVLGVVANGVNIAQEAYGYGSYYPDKKYLKAAG
ncbi:MAG: polysaccharide biosynthesis tyrosine autokinase [Cyanobacteria bacterium P01_A01_bin.83]